MALILVRSMIQILTIRKMDSNLFLWGKDIEFHNYLIKQLTRWKPSHQAKGLVGRATTLQIGGQQFKHPQMHFGVFLSSFIEWS